MKRLFRAAAAAGLSALAVQQLYRYAFSRSTPLLIRRLEGLRPNHYRDEQFHAMRAEAANRALALPHVTLTGWSPRGIRVRGTLWQAGAQPSATVVMIVHGLRSTGVETAAPYIPYYHSRGIDVFAPDHEAAGQSSGSWYSYGYHEAVCCIRWLDQLIERYGREVKLILHGSSMGAATVLQMSDCCPPQVRFLVSDCAFTSAREILLRQAKNITPAYSLLRLLCRLHGCYDLDRADARPHVCRADRPILFVHGTEDQLVPCAMTDALFRLCASDKELLHAEGARHAESIFYRRQEYEALLDQFLHRYC